jgi:di-trans,poly-cis-decaprenylcistransferase
MNSSVQSIGFIVDGNRRWAVEQGMSKLEGHRYGADRVMDVIDWAFELGVKQLCFYLFSTENWNRTPIEVKALMSLFEVQFKKFAEQARRKGAQIHFIGRKTDFSPKLQKPMVELEAETAHNQQIEIFFAVSYGGRAEIIEAIKTLRPEQLANLTEQTFESSLWSAGLTDPELIIRTGGDHRLSNFLLWKSSYSELVFTQTKWPDFSQEELQSIIKNYQQVRINKGK